MSIKTMVLAAVAALTLAAPAAAFAHDYDGPHGYDRGDYGHRYGAGYGYRHDDGYGWRRGYERDWRARWDGPARYRDHDGWRGSGWRDGGYRHYGWRD